MDDAYELDSPDTLGAFSLDRQDDKGYGIMVTKVEPVKEISKVMFVLTMLQVISRLEDPIPTPVNVHEIAP
jgi:hypothetical protein